MHTNKKDQAIRPVILWWFVTTRC